ncbi:3-deoxy-manno-octulosonate cytidylyltransferase [Tissierella sp. Yu-01]|uniref:3-deoxy-manno-octulosonate cytidylyltransferase n=1 Tax=Tissierella sp. Yu-01 TaxID=3035694 RepID=UPI00240DC1EC|nr:3-deoxy-manno-octulosonate cytidylyltransferase [Tissierella sp. Yu-01]WFA07910.1 3-deoxy-manno-octulosonate cytidylyltransferase [Tissierella sp. Yu-01]
MSFVKIIGIVPARYKSTRFEGKVLADICGKPMIWWVYKQLINSRGITEVYVATDDNRIKDVCEAYNMNVVMTSEDHPTHLDRLYEASTKIDGDFFINVNGDEPLIEKECIETMIPHGVDPESSYAANAMMILEDPIDVVDSSKIKIATDIEGYGLYMARSPIPFPKGCSDYKFKKFVGVQCFTKSALRFCFEAKRGYLESIEDIDEFRFLENGHKLKFIETSATTLSVDTPKDLEKVRKIIEKRIREGRIAF